MSDKPYSATPEPDPCEAPEGWEATLAEVGPFRQRYLRLDPLLSDGQHWTVAEPAQALAALLAWMHAAEEGDSVMIKFVDLTYEEREGLRSV
jgi:hypothetical protein